MTEEAKLPLLIVGLGNPGKRYDNTRHNIGFVVGRAVAQACNVSLEHHQDFSAEFGQGFIEDRKLMVLLPKTYMNLSGQSVRKCVDFFKIASSQVMVVCDDVTLPFGKLRLREKGSSGGHNGLKNIEAHLGDQYLRLRVGVGRQEGIDLADFVLGHFQEEEIKQLPEIVENAKEVLLIWARQGYSQAVRELSRQTKPKEPPAQQPGKENKI